MKTSDSIAESDRESSLRLPFAGRFWVAGAVWKVSTDSQEIVAILQDVFQLSENNHSPAELEVFFHVDSGLPDPIRQTFPHFRALEHLYYGTFGSGDSMLVDQLHRRVVGSFSLATVGDVRYWKRVILPCLLGITSSCVGVTPVHCACVEKDQLGLLIHGASGAGKSTLALSLSMKGFSYVSDDCTYISHSGNRLRSWGSSAPLKLLPEAKKHFPLLANAVANRSLNGELAFEIDPNEIFGIKRSSSCDPRWLLFIERTHEPKFDCLSISREEAALRLASDLELLPLCIAGQREHQLAVIDTLVQRECWRVRHGLQPEALATSISEFCSSDQET